MHAIARHSPGNVTRLTMGLGKRHDYKHDADAIRTYQQNKQGRYVKALAASFVHRQQDTGVLNIYKVNVNAS